MIGLGTLIDVTLILLGGFAGLAFGRFISERIQDTLLKATAVAIIFIGISGAMSARNRNQRASLTGHRSTLGAPMIGLGTLIDVTLILLGGFAGLAFGRFISERIQDTLLKATAVAIIFIGISGAMSGMLTVSGGEISAGGSALVVVSLALGSLIGEMLDLEISAGGSALVVVSLALGSLIGEMLDLERQIDRFGEWLKYATGSSGDSEFVDAFVTASLSVAIGAMSIVGSIQDGMMGDWTTLAIKGAIDALLVCTMTASMGKGCIFAAIPVLALQGALTLLASFLQPLVTAAALANLSTVGSILRQPLDGRLDPHLLHRHQPDLAQDLPRGQHAPRGCRCHGGGICDVSDGRSSRTQGRAFEHGSSRAVCWSRGWSQKATLYKRGILRPFFA